MGLGDNIFLPIYVHNLAYEFQFIKDRFVWQKVFALDTRKVNYCRTDSGIEFRCSYQLSGYNLATLGKNLQKYKVSKMEGDLDYSKLRTKDTKLTDTELGYCIHDVLVVMAYIQECIEQENGIQNIPLTKTGYVRRYVKRECLGTSKHRNERYRKFIHAMTLEPDEYLQLRRAFQGGFTHANVMHVGVTIKDVDSYGYPKAVLSNAICQYYLSNGYEDLLLDADGNKVYINTINMEKINNYLSIYEAILNKSDVVKGCLYLDSNSENNHFNTCGGNENNGSK